MRSVYLLLVVLQIPIDGWTQNNTDSTSLVFRIHAICEQLANEAVVESERIGSIALPSEQWKRFKTLLSLSNDSTLTQLTEHSSPTVRVYAFWGLISRNSPLVVETIKKHELDSASVLTLNGCIVKNESVYDFVVSTAHYEAKKLNTIDRTYIEDAYQHVRNKQLTIYRLKKESGN